MGDDNTDEESPIENEVGGEPRPTETDTAGGIVKTAVERLEELVIENTRRADSSASVRGKQQKCECPPKSLSPPRATSTTLGEGVLKGPAAIRPRPTSAPA